MKERPPYTIAQAGAMRALSGGTANEEQQRIALLWILNEVCELPKWPYMASERDTNVELGKRFVGHRVYAATQANISQLEADWRRYERSTRRTNDG